MMKCRKNTVWRYKTDLGMTQEFGITRKFKVNQSTKKRVDSIQEQGVSLSKEMQTPEVKNSVTDVKYVFGRLIRRLDTTEKEIREYEDMAI